MAHGSRRFCDILCNIERFWRVKLASALHRPSNEGTDGMTEMGNAPLKAAKSGPPASHRRGGDQVVTPDAPQRGHNRILRMDDLDDFERRLIVQIRNKLEHADDPDALRAKLEIVIENIETTKDKTEASREALRSMGFDPDRREFSKREDKTLSAERYLLTTWGDCLQSKVLFQHMLTYLDPGLMQALRNQFKGKADALGRIIPKKSDAVSAQVARCQSEGVLAADMETDAARRHVLRLRSALGRG